MITTHSPCWLVSGVQRKEKLWSSMLSGGGRGRAGDEPK